MISVKIGPGDGVVMSVKVNHSIVLYVLRLITYRDRHNHLQVHFNNPNQYLVSRMCKVNKHISQYRFKHFYCRFCIYLHRYRYHHTKESFLEHAKKYNIHEVVSAISEAGSQIEVKL